MTLQSDLFFVKEQVAAQVPAPVLAAMDQATAELTASGQAQKALQPGQRMSDFVLTNATGRRVASMVLRAGGPLLITFYRGEWCPYCNLALRALQRELPAFARRGVTLVAISPELPDHSLTLQHKHGLAFEVLSDAGNAVARSFGLVFTLPEALRPIYEGFGVDLPARNADASFELPVPGTFLVGGDGTVLASFVDVDYRTRLEPAEALAWIDRRSAAFTTPSPQDPGSFN